jgi:hypothetical protein
LNFRLTAAQERALRRAAALTGQSVSGFVLSSAVEHAQEVIDRSNRVELSARSMIPGSCWCCESARPDAVAFAPARALRSPAARARKLVKSTGRSEHLVDRPRDRLTRA